MNKKLIFAGIVLTIIALALVMSGYLTLTPDIKTQLASEYTTRWASSLDQVFPTYPNFASGSGSGFSWNDKVTGDNDKITIGIDPRRGDGSLSDSHNYYGQEVVLLAATDQVLRINGFDLTISNTQSPQVVKLIPHTLDLTKVDLFSSNMAVPDNTFTVSNPFNIVFTGVRSPIYFIGYKSVFSCNLAPDEVWVQESFSSPFSNKDLSFSPTKYCNEARPFTLRSILQGETPIKPNPIFDFNKGSILDPAGGIITVNYATPNVAGVLNPCAPDQSNVKVAGKWVCTQVIKTTTLTRIVNTREIINIPSANQFTFTSSATKPSFNIGNAQFTAQQKFDCAFPSDVDIVRPPDPQGCYSSAISYNSNSYALKDKSLINLNDKTSVQYFAGGEYTRTSNNLIGTYVFNVIDALNINLNGGISFKQYEKAVIPITITNNLPQNTITLKINQKIGNTNQILPEKIVTLNANNGINNYNIADIDTSNLGVNTITIQAFYPIEADSKILIASDKIIINIEILGQQPSIIKFVDRQVPVYVKVHEQSFIEQSFIDKLISFFKSLFASIFS